MAGLTEPGPEDQQSSDGPDAGGGLPQVAGEDDFAPAVDQDIDVLIATTARRMPTAHPAEDGYAAPQSAYADRGNGSGNGGDGGGGGGGDGGRRRRNRGRRRGRGRGGQGGGGGGGLGG